MRMHETFWAGPAALWMGYLGGTGAAPRENFPAPAILRFNSDSFMEDLMALLEKDPARVAELVARPETWRGLVATPDADGALQPQPPKTVRERQAERRAVARAGQTRAAKVKSTLAQASAQGAPLLKLYQPAHQRYYLVGASLVCGIPGLPDLTVDAGKQEGLRYVLRRLLPPAGASVVAKTDTDIVSWEEHAYVVGPSGAGWHKLADPQRTAPGEELLPLFPLTYREDDGRRRRLVAGLIPVGRRDAYHAAARTDSLGNVSLAESKKTPRKLLFRSQVAEPWKNVINRAVGMKRSATRDPAADIPDLDKQGREERKAHENLMTASWYVLLDFAEYLKEYLPAVWDAVLRPMQAPALTEPNQVNLLAALNATALPADFVTRIAGASYLAGYRISGSLADALKNAFAWKQDLEAVDTEFEFESAPKALTAAGRTPPTWPDFLFPLADFYYNAGIVRSSAPTVAIAAGAVSDAEVDRDGMLQQETGGDLAAERAAVDQLVALIVKALPADDPGARAPAVPAASRPTLLDQDGVFRIRCVLARPQCGTLHPELVSDPTRAFRLAAFFDPDAPARPIRIGLPLDTTPAGLRKFDKNTAFIMSDILCGQVQRLKGITLGDLVRSVLPWPFHKDLSAPAGGPCQTGGGSAGMVCSLSIPIITLCALILLMIIVTILDFFFRWIPWLIMCFPIPGLKGKR